MKKVDLHNMMERVRVWWFGGKKGTISQKRVMYLAYRSLISRPSRALITISAIALGTAAIVFLVSFAYGLQDIVTKRIVQPKSMRMIDVVSGTTNLQLSQTTVEELLKLPNVEGISRAVAVAGVVSLNNSRMDTVVVSVDGNYFDYANPVVEHGEWMSKGALVEVGIGSALMEQQGLAGEVAGLSTDEQKTEVKVGELVDNKIVNFRVDDDTYIPLRESPKINASVIGYVKGSMMSVYEGQLVWGGQYESIDASGKAFVDQKGNWFGKWIVAEIPLYTQTSPGFYEPAVSSDQLGQVVAKGYVGMSGAKLLSSVEKEVVEKLFDNKEGEVLGDSTPSSKMALSFTGGSSTTSAELMQSIAKEKEVAATASSGLAILEIKKQDGHEVLISTAFLKALDLKKEEIVGKTLRLEYIITGSVLPLGLSGRVLTQPVDYKVVGVFKEDTKPVLMTPLSDLLSIGVSRYNTVKVLANKPENLVDVRQRIQLMGFTTTSIVDTLAQVDRLFRILRFVLGAFGVIALVVALFGMFNTLTISLMERTRELGVMKTLGTTDSDVFRLFMAESLIIGAVGGVAGIVIGIAGGQVMNLVNGVVRGGFSNSMFKTPFGFVFGVFVLALLIGLATGFYPSRRAIKINPLDALRYE